MTTIEIEAIFQPAIPHRGIAEGWDGVVFVSGCVQFITESHKTRDEALAAAKALLPQKKNTS